jgi:GT2 family glycosyltransferase
MAADLASLAAEIRRRLGPVLALSDWPLVSIVVPNRDGADLLRRLLAGLVECTDYPRLELILVDNGSSDDSLDFARAVEAPFPISIVANPYNESFSGASNQGAELASGELLLFLNNDTEPFEPGWLQELVACLRRSAADAVAATLVCLDEEHEASFSHGYGVQHRGLAFREEGGMIHPALHGWEADPLDERLGEDIERGAVAAACLMVGRSAFERVGGFSHGYVYGVEDVDLCLKLRQAGLGILCSGRAVLVHHPVSTRRAAPFPQARAQKLANRRVLWERWGPRLRRHYELDRLDGGGIWADAELAAADRGEGGSGRPSRAELEAPSFCLEDADPRGTDDLAALGAALRRRGHRCLVLGGDRVEDPIGLNYDVAVQRLSRVRYLPKPARLNVLWAPEGPGSLPEIERSRYDLALSGADGLRALDPDEVAVDLLAAVSPHLDSARLKAR